MVVAIRSAQTTEISFLVKASPSTTDIHIATWSDGQKEPVSEHDLDARCHVFGAVLRSAYPAIDLSSEPSDTNEYAVSGIALGVPTAKRADPASGALPPDRLIRGLAGLEWACLVLAEPWTMCSRRPCGIALSMSSEPFRRRRKQKGDYAPLASYYSRTSTGAVESVERRVGPWTMAHGCVSPG